MAKTREELMQYAQREYRVVDGARLQTLTELELVSLRSRWGERYNKTKDVDLVMRRELVVACLVDDDGHRLFSDDEVNLLADWNGSAVERLYDAARELCGLDRSEVDEVEKKSEPTTATS